MAHLLTSRLLLALICTFFSTAAFERDLPECTLEACPQCLRASGNASSKKLTVFAAEEGVYYETPFRIGRSPGYWDTNSVYSQVIGIIIAEQLGFQIEYVACEDEYQCILAASHCAGWLDWECLLPRSDGSDNWAFWKGRNMKFRRKLFNDTMPDIMFVPELYESDFAVSNFEDTHLETWTELLPERLGPSGFTAYDGLFVYGDLAGTMGGKVDHFGSYLRGERPGPGELRYLTSPATLMDAGVAAEVEGCTAEEGSVATSGMAWLSERNWKCVDSWWLTPACARFGDDWRHKCFVILDDDWGYHKPKLYEAIVDTGLPAAKLTVGYDPHWELVMEKQFNVTFTWWQPDSTYVKVKPLQIWMGNATPHHEVPLKAGYKLAMAADETLAHLLKSVFIETGDMNQMVNSLAEADEDPSPELFQYVACHWVRDNEKTWKRWLPSPSAFTCDLGLFFDNRTGACVACPPGKAGVMIVRVPGCQPCAPGQYADRSGTRVCGACGKGEYAAGTGNVKCERCELGRFQALSAQTQCVSCETCRDCVVGAKTTTFYLGGTSSTDCVCPVGTYFESKGRVCVKCQEVEGLRCPGGHAPVFDSADNTPTILDGHMTMSDAPLEPYTCVSEERCVGGRPAFNEAAMCPDNFKISPRCSECKPNYLLKGDSCKECSDSLRTYRGLIIVATMFAFIFSQVLLTAFLYWRHNRPNPPGAITINMLITFVQQVHVLLSFSLVWASNLRDITVFFDNMLTVSGTFDFFQGPCYALVDVDTQNFILEITAPIGLLVSFVVLELIGRLIKRRLKLDFVLNTLGMLMKTIFISVARMSLLIFLTEEMPNGKLMVKKFPSLEFGSKRWLTYMPFSIVASLAYVATFLAYVAYAVAVAPQRAAAWPGFMNRYRFAFGALRPDKWWWILLQLAFQLSLVLVQAALDDQYGQIYTSALFTIVIAALQFHYQPFKFYMNNIVDLNMKCSLLLFLVLCTSFFDPEFRSTEGAREAYGWICIFALLFAVLVAVYHIATFTLQKFHVLLEGDPAMAGVQAAELAFLFQETSLKLTLLSDKEILKVIGSLGEMDLIHLRNSHRSVIATLFHLQPGNRFFEQRIMPGVPYKVYNEREVAEEVIDSISSGRLQEQVAVTWQTRLALLSLAKAMRSQVPKPEAGSSVHHLRSSASFRESSQKAVKGAVAKLAEERRTETVRQMARLMNLTKSHEVNLEEFLEKVKPVVRGIPDSRLRKVFELLDVNDSGKISMQEFMMVIMSELHDVDSLSEEVQSGLVRAVTADLDEQNPTFDEGVVTEASTETFV